MKKARKNIRCIFLNVPQTKNLLSYLIKLEQCSHLFLCTELEDEIKVIKIMDYCSTKSVDLADFIKKLTQ